MSARRALITGVAGQDGSYLAELLLDRGYEVFGIVRGSPHAPLPEPGGVQDDIRLLQGDLLDQMTLLDAITRAEPDELYNLAATSFVPASWRQPVMTAQFTAVGVTSMLEAVRITKPDLRVYQASTSEMFGATTRVAAARVDAASRRTTPTRWPSSTGTSWSRPTASATACTPARDPLQPRVAAPAAGVRQPQGHPDRGGDQARPRRRAAPRRPGRAARLELRRRRRRGDVADAPAGAATTTSSAAG